AELHPARSKPSIAAAEARKFDLENYVIPSIDLLDEHDPEGRGGADPAELEQVQSVLIETLGQFGIAVAAATLPKDRRSRVTKFIRPRACGWTKSSRWNAIWRARPAPSGSIFWPQFPGKTQSGSRSPTRARSK